MYKLLSSKVLLFAILVISFFGMNLEEGKGQVPCPPGTTEISLPPNPPIIVNVGGCLIKATYCVSCSPTSNGPTYVALHSWVPLDQNCYDANGLNAKMVHDSLNAWPFAAPANLNRICNNGLVPCEEGLMDILVWETICWQFVLVNGVKWAINCDMVDNYCSKYVRICYDSQTQTLVKISETPPSISGYPTCTVTYDDAEEEVLTSQNPYSSCFYFPDNMCGYTP